MVRIIIAGLTFFNYKFEPAGVFIYFISCSFMFSNIFLKLDHAYNCSCGQFKDFQIFFFQCYSILLSFSYPPFEANGKI